MAVGDIPTITDSAHTHTIYNPSNFTTGRTVASTATQGIYAGALGGVGDAQAMQQVFFRQPAPSTSTTPQPKKERIVMSTPQRRIVQVFIADTEESVPLEKSVIYKGEQKLTDATDQELFFEIDIKKILDAHNAYRTTLVNKKVKERTENLEPVKIRDLKMVVVNVATF